MPSSANKTRAGTSTQLSPAKTDPSGPRSSRRYSYREPARTVASSYVAPRPVSVTAPSISQSVPSLRRHTSVAPYDGASTDHVSWTRSGCASTEASDASAAVTPAMPIRLARMSHPPVRLSCQQTSERSTAVLTTFGAVWSPAASLTIVPSSAQPVATEPAGSIPTARMSNPPPLRFSDQHTSGLPSNVSFT